MPCYHPVEVPIRGFRDLRVTVPCRGCVGCRLDMSNEWAARCVHESKLHPVSCMATLTYDEEHLPAGGSLVPEHLSVFVRAVRDRGYRVRYFGVGEYGEKFTRPHYHVILFGWWPKDAKPIPGRRKPAFSSVLLDDIWGKGRTELAPVNNDTAAYCARYVMKKVNGDLAPAHYQRIDPETGEVYKVAPEFSRMSRRPGIGAEFFDRFESDIYPSDFVVMKGGRKTSVPAYYDKLYARRRGKESLAEVKQKRIDRANEPKQKANRTPSRLRVREVVKKAAVSTLRRELK